MSNASQQASLSLTNCIGPEVFGTLGVSIDLSDDGVIHL